MRAVQLIEFGGVDALRPGQIEEPMPSSGQVLIDVRHAGINFADISRRRGTYDRRGQPPLVLGAEVAGTRRDNGQRVAALTGGYGGYAEVAAADEHLTFPIPDDLDDLRALALLLQGLTAYHVLKTSARLQAGETVAIHAAAGGVGSIAVQLAKLWNAKRVIGIASTQPKRDRVLALGADAAVDAQPQGLGERIVAANLGQRVDVIAEMVGGEVFDESLRALAEHGRIVVFGLASGTARNESTHRRDNRMAEVVEFSLPNLLAERSQLAGPLSDLFAAAIRGAISPVIGGIYALNDVATAHADLAARRTMGKLILRIS